MHRAGLAFCVLSLAVPRAAWPQGQPLGAEFRVNTYTTNSQAGAAVAADPAGNFVVVWEGAGPGDPLQGIFGQRFASSGVPLGPEFRVNSYTTDDQQSASVASDANGNFVVAWTRTAYFGVPDVFGQRYASDGTPLGAEFRVNASTTGGQATPAVAPGAAGGFVVVWVGQGTDDPSGIFGQRFASSGILLGPEFRVNSYTTGQQFRAAVAADPAGNFVVVWEGSGSNIFGQRFASGGTPLGQEFRINTYTTGTQSNPAVTASSGQFTVVWDGEGQGDPSIGIFGQRFSSAGVPLGPEFRVNSYTADSQRYPSVVADSVGNFVVAWTRGYVGTSHIAAQRYATDGTPLGPEFRVNTHTTYIQNRAAVAADQAGAFVVVWDDSAQDGSFTGVFGQRYGRIVPVELMRFRVE